LGLIFLKHPNALALTLEVIMALEPVISCIASVAGNVVGFSAKQMVIVRGIGVIRDEIHRIVASIAEQHFGSWIGNAIGFQAGLSLALPVTCFIGDLIWTCISEAVHSIIVLSAEVLGIIKRRSGWLINPLMTAVRVAAVAIGYFVKCLVCNYAMPFVEASLDTIFRRVLPVLIENNLAVNVLTPLVSAGATILTPTITILAADIIGMLVQLLFYHGSKAILSHTVMASPSSSLPEEKRIPVGLSSK
jgi:hypothetical protein